jgi:hypothetical protein
MPKNENKLRKQIGFLNRMVLELAEQITALKGAPENRTVNFTVAGDLKHFQELTTMKGMYVSLLHENRLLQDQELKKSELVEAVEVLRGLLLEVLDQPPWELAESRRRVYEYLDIKQ